MSPLFYLKKKDNNNTKTKHEFYVTHCSKEKRRQ